MAFVPKMEDKSAPQEGPREGAPASPGAGPNSPLHAANKHDAPTEDTAPGGSSHRRDKPQVDLCDCHLFLSVE